MEVLEQLKKLKNLLEEERNILLRFPLESVERFLEVQEEKRKLLLQISSRSEEELIPFKDEVLEIYELNAEVSSLISNHMAFFEEIEKELFGDSVTYGGRERDNIFKGKA